ncbi:MAG: MarR family transcriptional regulator, partial [Brachybacterium sp.]|nr:MarR family transcriptional regulator [Brachybacterium sp.]
MFVALLTPRRGAASRDPLPDLARTVAALPVRRPVERTLGDGAIVVADRAEEAVDLLRATSELGTWCVGLGVGAVEDPVPSEVRALRGPAMRAAEDALRAARVTAQVPLAVRAGDARQADTARDAEAVLRLIGWMIATRNAGQWRVVRALR